MLDHKVCIYVPGTVAVNHQCPTSQARWADKALEKLSLWFGGATSLPGIGAWVSPTFGLVKEPIIFVFSFTDQGTLDRNVDAVMALAGQIGADMGQEAVGVEIDGRMHLVAGSAAVPAA
jgi:hypothetical protein